MKLPFFQPLIDRLYYDRPLGWAQLFHQRTRLIVALTGVAFSNILIFTQLGLRALLFEGITLLPEALEGDLFIMSAFAPTIDFGSFPRIYVYQADAVEGVASTTPIYLGSANWVNPLDLETPDDTQGTGFNLFANRAKIIAFNPAQSVLTIPEVNQQLNRLNEPDAVLYDRLSQEKLGPISDLFDQRGEVLTIMNNRRVRVVGLFDLGSTLFDNAHVIMSDWNYAQRNGANSLNNVNVASIHLEPGADAETVRSRLQAHLSKDIKILTKEEIITLEKTFQESFPNGKVLNFGAAIGFIVGVVIVYQVLYTDVSDHLPEYATLKAMGYSDTTLLGVVLQEALILAVLGFIPGFFASYGVYGLLTWATRIPLTMKAHVAARVFLLTLVMCIISGAIAMNRLRSADPADVF
ncbi:MAG: FtsX-like permease family protein [Leptolyngbya sp. SIO1D8]|nr:FtsX-like permease family protein [Leptolyngbya sp. SIO1D8]